MTDNTDRILTALLIGPMTRAQIAKALDYSPSWVDRGCQLFVRRHQLIRIATPTFAGKLTWRYALTQRGTQAALQRIQ